MIRSFCLTILLIMSASFCLEAQEQQVTNTRMMQGLRTRALVLDISARVLNDEQEVVWNESHRKITIPGSPVGIQMVGSNIVVAVQFTPYIRRHGNVMVAQGQIWLEDPERGISYYTSIQTIPMEFDEPIYFFPLGTSPQFFSSIEIMITVKPNNEINSAEEAEKNGE
ncbi:MAG: hypothetical protein FWD22_01895 [Treponema sp.]|nr:hypothetical protein [Treponema sp.]